VKPSEAQPCDRFDVLTAGFVEHAAAFGARDHQWTFQLVSAEIGLHVHETGNVARLD